MARISTMPERRRPYDSPGKAFKANSHARTVEVTRRTLTVKGHSTVPAQAEQQMTDFGLQGIGYILGGGFPTNSVYLLTGDPGTFYPTFAQQALYNASKKGTKVVYYTSEASSEDIMQDMGTFKWDISEAIDNGSWVFTRVVPPQLKTIANSTPEDPREQRIDLPPNSLNALQEDFIEKLNEGRWSALSLSYVMKSYPAEDVTDLVMFWVNAAHKLGGVHFILLPKGIHNDADIAYLKSLVDGVMSFKFAQGFEQAEGEIDIEKLRRVIPRVKTIRHAVQDDGLSIETSARVG
jgi:KaiC/GvpD/RAD55 family RecA-like ATPase